MHTAIPTHGGYADSDTITDRQKNQLKEVCQRSRSNMSTADKRVNADTKILICGYLRF